MVTCASCVVIPITHWLKNYKFLAASPEQTSTAHLLLVLVATSANPPIAGDVAPVHSPV